MPFTVQAFYPDAQVYLNTNHVSDDLGRLRDLVNGQTFSGFKVRIVDDAGTVLYDPPARERVREASIKDIAALLGAPILDDLGAFPGGGDELDI